jgi:hypothetical protein
MGCNCGKKRMPRTPRVQAAEAPTPRKYENVTDATLDSRLPRLSLAPGEVLDLDKTGLSYAVRTWIRRGALAPVE